MYKRFYVVLFCVLSISVVLLGFSFSKESGSNDALTLAESKDDEYRVIYSNNKRLNTTNNDNLNISVINKMNKDVDYYLVLDEINNTSYDELYYVLDDYEEQKVINNTIFLGELKSYGKDGDHVSKSLRIFSKKDEELEFKLDIKYSVANSFMEKVKLSENVYRNKEDNFYFYGSVVNNYVKYQDDTCRIVGTEKEKILILCDFNYKGGYNDVLGRYLSIEELLATYGKDDAVSSNNLLEYESWITEEDDFWLADTYNNEAYYFSNKLGVSLGTKSSIKNYRYVFELGDETILIGGDGTKNNPYEVSYGS